MPDKTAFTHGFHRDLDDFLWLTVFVYWTDTFEDDGAFEPVFYNHDGFITECAIRNIFFIKKDVLLTPDLKLGVLPGVMRNAIISIAKEMNLTFREDNIPIKSINEMDEAFISSTGIGLLPCSWDGWKSDFTITINLKKKLNELINTTL